jgi:hypothetical protein
MEMSGQLHARPLYPSGKRSRYTFSRELRNSRAGLDDAVVKRIFAHVGNQTPVVIPVTSHYTTMKLDSNCCKLWS